MDEEFCVGVQFFQRVKGGQGFLLSNKAGGMDDLPLEILDGNCIGIRQTEDTNPGGG